MRAHRNVALGVVVALTCCLGAAIALVAVDRGGSASDDLPPQTALIPNFGGLFGASAFPSREVLEHGWKTNFTKHTVPLSEFQRGGPGRDGIRAVDDPWVVAVEDVDFLPEDEPVLEVVANGEARAYPFGRLVVREIVNDTVGGIPVVVTFCPLCNTALAFVREVRGRTLTFGVTGNLRNSDLVMYDRQTESWWQQYGGKAVVGRFAGARLKQLPARGIPWGEFREAHRDGFLVTTRREFDLPYGENPYLGYLDPRQPPFFPTANAGDVRLPPSERVVFVERAGKSVAVPFSVLEAKGRLSIDIADTQLLVSLDGRTASVRDESGRLVPFSEPFWFAVAAFRPDVEIVDD